MRIYDVPTAEFEDARGADPPDQRSTRMRPASLEFWSPAEFVRRLIRPGERATAGRTTARVRQVPGERAGVLALLVLATTALASALFHGLLGADGFTWLDAATLGLFAVLFGSIGFTFYIAFAGFVCGLRRREGAARPPRPDALGSSRTAVVMVIRHEDMQRVQAGIRAIYESLAATGPLAFTLFVLSDSTSHLAGRTEARAVEALVSDLRASGRIVYRRRVSNVGRKSGNLADFCERWGAQFDYMVVLDADSLMAGETIRELVDRMDRDPRLGILQVPTRPVNRGSLFGRIQQFAAAVYGPLLADGLAFWLGSAALYWGHNAIIRIAPFMRHCGLPRLPGREPLGGEILSHDFVGGALMRRAGWDVRLAADLGGSYEELPASLLGHAARDRRWCQGNLQHLRLLFARGFLPVSRLTFAVGALGYLAAPAWVAFVLLVSLGALPASAAHVGLGPVGRAGEATPLVAMTLGFLFLPKVFAFLRLALRPRDLARLGGRRSVVVSVLAESLFAIAVAPVLMTWHTLFVLAVLVGSTVGWGPQSRGEAETELGDAVRAHTGQTLVGLAAGACASAVRPELFLWLLPAVAGLVLSIPLSVVSSRVAWGQTAKRWGLFLIPEETEPPAVLRSLQWHLRVQTAQPDSQARPWRVGAASVA